MIITFLGHRFLKNHEAIFEKIKKSIIEHLKYEEKMVFYCGGYGDFDNLSAHACHQVKKIHPNSEVIYVTPYIIESGQEGAMLLKEYDSISYPPLENVPPKFAICKRNEWMIEKSDLIIAYVNATYGGAYKSLQYAKRKGKQIINLAEL